MLGKLIKYEFKSTSRIMWFLYGGLIIVGLLLGIFLRVQSHVNMDSDAVNYYSPLFSMLEGSDNPLLRIVVGALVAIYALMIQAVAIMTLIMIITRFNKNILGGEGYLMHTLPVKTHNLIISKGLVAIIWMIIGVIAGIISAFMLALTSGALKYILEELSWDQVKEMLSYLFTSEAVLLMILVIVSAITSILTFYVSMAIGNLANKNKFLFAVLAYLGIQVVSTTIASIITFASGGIIDWIISSNSFDSILIFQIVHRAILAIVFFFGTNYILKNKLNLA